MILLYGKRTRIRTNVDLNLSLRNRKSHTDRAVSRRTRGHHGQAQAALELLHVRSHFDEFLKSYKLRSLEAAEILEIKGFMAEIFPNEQVTLEPDEKSRTLTVSVQTPEGKLDGQFTIEPLRRRRRSRFPAVSNLSVGDPGLAWVFGRVETSASGGAHRLNSAEEEFWQTRRA